MKILFINTGPWGTGSFTVVKGLADALLELGQEVKILFPDAGLYSSDKNEYYQNTELYHIWKFPIANEAAMLKTFPLMITDPHPRSPDAMTFKNLTTAELDLYLQDLKHHIQTLIKAFKPDIVECHHIWYASWLCYKLDLDYIVMGHHSDQLGFKYFPAIQAQAIQAAQHAKKIFAISKSVKREIERLYHVDENKIYLTHNGYDKKIFKKYTISRQEVLQKLKLQIPDDVPIISFAGKLSRTKGVDVLFKANKMIQEKVAAHTIVMGAGVLEDICDKLDPESYSLENMHFIGHQPPQMVADIHNIAKVGVMPSRSEGFGVSCLEAMACGLPMVVTKSGGPETFAVGKIIERGHAEALAEGILFILDLSASQHAALSDKAIAKAAHFTWKAVAEKHLAIYQKILKNRDVEKTS